MNRLKDIVRQKISKRFLVPALAGAMALSLGAYEFASPDLFFCRPRSSDGQGHRTACFNAPPYPDGIRGHGEDADRHAAGRYVARRF